MTKIVTALTFAALLGLSVVPASAAERTESQDRGTASSPIHAVASVMVAKRVQ